MSDNSKPNLPSTTDACGKIEEGLRAALEEILNPIAALKRRAEAEGCQLEGGMAHQLSNDPNYLKQIAKRALASSPVPPTIGDGIEAQGSRESQPCATSDSGTSEAARKRGDGGNRMRVRRK